MSHSVNSVWLVTREYAGIAEAGGVKNVACSLAEGLVRQNIKVCVFIPRYGCVSTVASPAFSSTVFLGRQQYPVDFSVATMHGVEVIFVDSELFSSKHDVYLYTEAESRLIPGAVRGKGHTDGDIMNLLLQKAVLAYAESSTQIPDVLHGQDAHTAMLPALIRTNAAYDRMFRNTLIVITVHNAGPGYRQSIPSGSVSAGLIGLDPAVLDKAVFKGNIEPFLLAAEYGILTTVSPWYADELSSSRYNTITDGLSGEFERRGIRIVGITNGIDYHKYEPSDIACSLLPFAFNPETGSLSGKYANRKYLLDTLTHFNGFSGMTCFGTLEHEPGSVYFSYHGRIASQKGVDVLAKSAVSVLDSLPQARFIILGQGDPALESMLIEAVKNHPGRFVYLRGYERSLARLAVAVSDFLVLPSAFEPCGLEDFIGQIFGTIPVAHAVGGLNKIIQGKTGFLYESRPDIPDEQILSRLLLDLVKPVLEGNSDTISSVPVYLEMIKYASRHVREEYNWDSIIRDRYIPLYRQNPAGSA